MTAPGVVHWDNLPVLGHVGKGVHNALSSAAEYGHAYWDSTVPVSNDPRTSGDLQRSWGQEIHPSPTGYRLRISANTRYAIYVELGAPAKGMGPRAPLRATGGEIAAILESYLKIELSDY